MQKQISTSTDQLCALKVLLLLSLPAERPE